MRMPCSELLQPNEVEEDEEVDKSELEGSNVSMVAKSESFSEIKASSPSCCYIDKDGVLYISSQNTSIKKEV